MSASQRAAVTVGHAGASGPERRRLIVENKNSVPAADVVRDGTAGSDKGIIGVGRRRNLSRACRAAKESPKLAVESCHTSGVALFRQAQSTGFVVADLPVKRSVPAVVPVESLCENV